MKILLNISIVVASFFFMEFVAWFTHKYLMHGFLWKLHYDHHNKQPGYFEKNDSFFLIFAIPSWLFIMFGMLNNFDFRTWIGFGIILYGIAYFLVHDVLIHRRFKKLRKFFFENKNWRYLEVLQYAHRMHHSNVGKQDSESFGMLIVSKKYYKKFAKKNG